MNVFRVLAVAVALAAQTEPSAAVRPTDDARSKGWQAYFLETAKAFRIGSKKAETDGELHGEPVLRWSQPVRGGDDGATFVWVRGERPEVIGTIFAWPHPDGHHVVAIELHSLALGPFEATIREGTEWNPEAAGIELRPIPKSGTPAATERLRLLQMRTLARRFDVESTDADDKDWPLRLLAQPLFRYTPAAGSDVVDGALFAFTQGTDPEAILVVEARRRGDEVRWEYAFARFTDYRLRARIDEAEVWAVDKARFGDVKGVHFVTNIAEKADVPGTNDGSARAESPTQP